MFGVERTEDAMTATQAQADYEADMLAHFAEWPKDDAAE